MWNYIDVFKGDLKYKELLKFIPDGQEDAAKIVLENGQTLDVWKTDDQIRNLGPVCISCAKGGCRKIEVIIDGDLEISENARVDHRYQKVTSLYNEKCRWTQKDYRLGSELLYEGRGQNVWLIKQFDTPYIRIVQDMPCPTVANTFEYRKWGGRFGYGKWKPAPINSIIIKRAE